MPLKKGTPPPSPESLSHIIFNTTKTYLDSLDPAALPPADQIEAELIQITNGAIHGANAIRPKDEAFTKLRSLTFSQIAQILLALHHVIKVTPSGKNTDPDYDLLAIYCDEGEHKGTYLTAEDDIRSVARRYSRNLKMVDFKEVLAVMRESAPRTSRTDDKDAIAVNNGIFDYASKTLNDFSPDYIFLSKSSIPFDATATNPILVDLEGNNWDVETWMNEISDDPEIVELLWQVLGAVIRPNVSWNKSAWFYSDKGNNGKGTLVELMRNLCGPGSYASLPLADMGKDFMLEPLTRASAIIVDENDVGQFIDRAANLKAIITNDVLMINRKHKSPISYQFRGFMVQCLNEFPRIKDKSDSFYRRQLFIPFDKCFTGREKKWIKDSFMSNDAVLRYVMRRVLELTPNYYSLNEPDATIAVLEEYKLANDPVRAFWAETKDEYSWDLLPFDFLYSAFRTWFTKNNPSGSILGKQTFTKDCVNVLASDPDWSCDNKRLVRSKGRMDWPEPAIISLGIDDWRTQGYTGKDPKKITTPELAIAYRGALRLKPQGAPKDTP